MDEFFVEATDYDAKGVGIRGDSFMVTASSEEGAIAKFKSIVPMATHWSFKVTKV